MRRPIRSPRLATLCLQGKTAASTKDNIARIRLLEEAARILEQQKEWHPLDALVLPGGFFWLSRALGASDFQRRRSLVSGERFAAAIPAVLKPLDSFSPGIRLITGIMAKPRDKAERTEQACLAFDRTGLIGAARKIFPTLAESRGRRLMTPFVEDYRSEARFIELPNGSSAALHSCYDLFGTADSGSSGGARRTAIKVLRHSKQRLTESDEGFRDSRDACLAAWANQIATRKPGVLLATIHGFSRPGLDGYWQRHGIARASAAHGGALVVAAAHFMESLPEHGSTLAACGVPRRELSAGVYRRAHSLAPHQSKVVNAHGLLAVLRLFQATARRTAKKGRTV